MTTLRKSSGGGRRVRERSIHRRRRSSLRPLDDIVGRSQEDFLRRATPIPRITALLVRREMLERVGLFDETLAFSEDDELILRLLAACPARRHGDDGRRLSPPRRERDSRAPGAPGTGQRTLRSARTSPRRNGCSSTSTPRLLRLHLKRLNRSTAANSAGRVIGDLKARRLGSAITDIGQSLRIAPLGFARGAVQTIGSRLRSRLRSHAR